MGQQQLLLIVLGVIVVGIAIVVGINLFNANAVQANRDGVISDLNNLASLAMSYYKKPTSMGGGGNTFDGGTSPDFSIPLDLDTTANGFYSAVIAAQTVTFTATGTETGNNGTGKIGYTAILNSAGKLALTPVN